MSKIRLGGIPIQHRPASLNQLSLTSVGRVRESQPSCPLPPAVQERQNISSPKQTAICVSFGGKGRFPHSALLAQTSRSQRAHTWHDCLLKQLSITATLSHSCCHSCWGRNVPQIDPHPPPYLPFPLPTPGSLFEC